MKLPKNPAPVTVITVEHGTLRHTGLIPDRIRRWARMNDVSFDVAHWHADTHVVALACVGRDMIKVWPLLLERPWWKEGAQVDRRMRGRSPTTSLHVTPETRL